VLESLDFIIIASAERLRQRIGGASQRPAPSAVNCASGEGSDENAGGMASSYGSARPLVFTGSYANFIAISIALRPSAGVIDGARPASRHSTKCSSCW